MIYIDNAQLVLENGILWDGAILINDNRIEAYGETGTLDVPSGVQRIDAGGCYIGPGFVDIHVHGGGGNMFFDEPEKAAAHFLRHGETTLLATSYTTYTKEQYLTSIDKIKKAMRSNGAGRAIAGFYMEGPYLNPRYGAEPRLNKWLGDINKNDYSQIVDEAGELARVWAIAPERVGISGFMEYVKHMNPNAVFAVAHSEATPNEIEGVKQFGIKLQTHCMNATGRQGEKAGIRAAGPDEYCLTDNEMYAELICDSSGAHVSAHIQRLILKTKGIDKLVLITDSLVADSDASIDFPGITDLSFDSDGNLYGSRLTMDVVCRNFMKHTRSGICEAFIAASRNPARVIGLDKDIGTIEIGKKANLVFVDDRFNVKKVILEGRFV